MNAIEEFGDSFIKQLNIIFKEHGAELHIIKPTYAYLQLGRYLFFFHKSKNKPIIQEEIETMKGEKLIKHILPYDGWEMFVGDLQCD